MFDLTGCVEMLEAPGETVDLAVGKNKAMIGGVKGNSFVFVEFEESGRIFEVATLALAAIGLDFAALVEGLLELAGKALALDGEVGDEAMGVDDVEGDFLVS